MAHNDSYSAPGNSSVKIISWNVKSLAYSVKRKRVLSHLQCLGVGTAFLQETHLRMGEHCRLHTDWVGQACHSKFNFKSRGVAILIHKNSLYLIPFWIQMGDMLRF